VINLEKYLATKSSAAVREVFPRVHPITEVPHMTTIFRLMENLVKKGIFATGDMLGLLEL
jgi:hypothetical protein